MRIHRTKLLRAGAAMATLATVVGLQLMPANIALAYSPTLVGVAECEDDGSIEVTWTFTSDTNISLIDITAPASIAATGVPTTTGGVPTTRSYTESYPTGTAEASSTVTVEFFYDNREDLGRQSAMVSATVQLPSDCVPPPVAEWCSPGYWRQPHHLDSWAATGIATSALYNTYFSPGLAGNPTLLTVLQNPQTYNRKGSGAFNNVGDLLSGAHPEINFDGTRVENCPLN